MSTYYFLRFATGTASLLAAHALVLSRSREAAVDAVTEAAHLIPVPTACVAGWRASTSSVVLLQGLGTNNLNLQYELGAVTVSRVMDFLWGEGGPRETERLVRETFAIIEGIGICQCTTAAEMWRIYN